MTDFVHMSQAALKQIQSGRSFREFPIYAAPMDNLICGIPIEVIHKFIGNSDIGSNGNIISSADNKKVTCPGCINVLKENGL